MSNEPTVYCDHCGAAFQRRSGRRAERRADARICTVCLDGGVKAFELPMSNSGLRATFSETDGLWLHFAASGAEFSPRLDALLDQLNEGGGVDQWIKDRAEQAAREAGI